MMSGTTTDQSGSIQLSASYEDRAEVYLAGRSVLTTTWSGPRKYYKEYAPLPSRLVEVARNLGARTHALAGHHVHGRA